MVICNTDPSIGTSIVSSIDEDDVESYVVWSELPLVQELSALNALLISTLCLGWGSLVLDVITASVKHCWARDITKEEEETSIWDGAILFEAGKY